MTFIPDIYRFREPEIGRIQGELVREAVARAAKRSPFYKERLAGARVRPSSIRSLADLVAIPPTSRQEVQRRPVGKAIAREQDVHVADRHPLERLADGADDGQLDVRGVAREVTMRQVLIEGIVFHIEHADGVHGVLSPLVP